MGEGGEDVGDGELDGRRVLKQAEVDVERFTDDAAGHLDVAWLDGSHADEVAAAVEVGGDELGGALRFCGELALLTAEGRVEEAEVVGAQGGGFAAEARGHGVLAESVHGGPFGEMGPVTLPLLRTGRACSAAELGRVLRRWSGSKCVGCAPPHRLAAGDDLRDGGREGC